MIKRNSKLKNGYKTEELFILKCLENEISISRPVFNIEPYDFIVEKGNNFFSVQVKKSWKNSDNCNVACLKSSYPRSKKENSASQNPRVDFIAVLAEEEEWYIIPRDKIKHIKTNISVSHNGNYGKYLNNFQFNLYLHKLPIYQVVEKVSGNAQPRGNTSLYILVGIVQFLYMLSYFNWKNKGMPYKSLRCGFESHRKQR